MDKQIVRATIDSCLRLLKEISMADIDDAFILRIVCQILEELHTWLQD